MTTVTDVLSTKEMNNGAAIKTQKISIHRTAVLAISSVLKIQLWLSTHTETAANGTLNTHTTVGNTTPLASWHSKTAPLSAKSPALKTRLTLSTLTETAAIGILITKLKSKIFLIELITSFISSPLYNN